MHAWEAIQKSLNYIELNIGEEIDIHQLAEESSLSLYYFQRLFSRLVKKPVREYIKLRRLSRSISQLQDTDSRIIDIALNYGFGSHETYTRAFKDIYLMTPDAFRKQPVMLNHFDKPDLLLNYTLVDVGVPLISEDIVLEMNYRVVENPRVFMGCKGYVPIVEQLPQGEATGVDVPGSVWESFHANKHKISTDIAHIELGVAYLGDAKSGYFTYFAGMEIAKNESHHEFEIWEFPQGEYLVCGFEAENFETLVTTALNKASKFCGSWIERHTLNVGAFGAELYYDSTPEGTYMELWFPLHKDSVT